ncbi:MAG: DNA repair protein RecN [Nitrospiria bacterium]
MLRELHIKNYAIIDEVYLPLSEGFNVITGETGAGKSILVEALSLLLGERSSLEGVRHGADEAIVEASFDPISSSPSDHSGNQDLLILKRHLIKSGKNRVTFNGSLANLATLKDVGRKLIEIHGQQGQHLLNDLDHQLFLLDAFCRLTADRSAYNDDFQKWSRKCQEMRTLSNQSLEDAKRRTSIASQLSEICQAKLSIDEEDELEQEAHALKNWESIRFLTQQAYSALSDEEGILSKLDAAGTDIMEIHRLTSDADSENDLFEQSEIQLKELTALLRTRMQDAEYQPERLEAVQNRLYLIQQLKRKYQRTVRDILDYQAEMEKELSNFSEHEHRLQEIQEEIAVLEKDLRRAAESLSRKRTEGTRRLSQKVETVLKKLGMEKTSFHISQRKIPFSENGADEIVFSIALPGEAPKRLAKIASGGELSRLMLALKVVLAEVDPAPTLVFDEVDAGIGGGVAERVGKQLSILSKNHQVLCITHLPQIASQADHHYFVDKKKLGNRVVTSIGKLSRTERVEELARMLGGVTITEITRRHAKEMIRATH